MAKKLGVDLGTINVIIYSGGQIVLQEPSMVALTRDDERIVAIGQEARDMYGRHPEHIENIPSESLVIRRYQETAGPLQDHTPESPVQKQTGRPGFCQTPRDHIGG